MILKVEFLYRRRLKGEVWLVITKRIKLTLELLGTGLYPIIEQEMKAVYQDDWVSRAKESFRNSPLTSQPDGDAIRWDAHSTLMILWDHWNSVFRNRLTPLERSYVGELREFRNRWAHQSQISTDDTLRILDTAARLFIRSRFHAGSTTASERTRSVTASDPAIPGTDCDRFG